MEMDFNLSEREKKIFEYMKAETQQKGYPPTVREMCDFLGIKSTSTVHKDLESLERKGAIRKDPSKPRAIEILEQPVALPAYRERIDIVDVPIVGRIAAGTPILAEQNIEDTFSVPARFIKDGVYFMLNVKGESMIDAGIFDGDYILVKQQNNANNGEMVVAMINGFESEATVKTFYKEKDHIRLQPENSTMKPIITRDVEILGLVKGVFRYFS
jgi:repressor LexA